MCLPFHLDSVKHMAIKLSCSMRLVFFPLSTAKVRSSLIELIHFEKKFIMKLVPMQLMKPCTFVVFQTIINNYKLLEYHVVLLSSLSDLNVASNVISFVFLCILHTKDNLQVFSVVRTSHLRLHSKQRILFKHNVCVGKSLYQKLFITVLLPRRKL